MLNPDLKKVPTAFEIMNSPFVTRFLFEESLRHKRNEHALDEALGKPFDQYPQHYEEKRVLG